MHYLGMIELPALKDVEEMVSTVPPNGTIRVTWHRVTFLTMQEVVSGTMGVLMKSLLEFS
jgi:hypothetical protein